MNINEILEFWLNECIKKDLYFEINPEKSKLLFNYVMNNDKRIKKMEDKINKVIKDLKNTLKYNMKHKDIRGNEYVDMDIDHIQMLIDMLEEINE